MPQRPPVVLPQIDMGRLLAKYPHLQTQAPHGRYDFTKSSNQYDITETILHEYFGVDVSLDRTKLCPRVPNRMEYLRICESLVAEIDPHGPSEWVIDVGTGSSLIFPLIGTSIVGSKYIATEIEPSSLQHARSIVERNELASSVHVVDPGPQSLLPCDELVRIIGDEHVKYTVCNPPFYRSHDDYLRHQRNKLESSSSQLTITDSELFTTGGEYHFITRLIADSMALAHRPQFQNTWFTSMVGIYANVKRLRAYANTLLDQGKIANYAFAEIAFHTKRWLLVWNFSRWRPIALHDTLPQLNRRDVVRIASTGNFSPEKIASALETSFARIHHQHGSFVYSLQLQRQDLTFENQRFQGQDQGPVLLVRTNAPVWTRSCRRKLLHRPDVMSFDCHVYISVSSASMVLVYGDENHFRAFVKYATAMCSEKSALTDT